jgi:hypothetical protein
MPRVPCSFPVSALGSAMLPASNVSGCVRCSGTERDGHRLGHRAVELLAVAHHAVLLHHVQVHDSGVSALLLLCMGPGEVCSTALPALASCRCMQSARACSHMSVLAVVMELAICLTH